MGPPILLGGFCSAHRVPSVLCGMLGLGEVAVKLCQGIGSLTQAMTTSCTWELAPLPRTGSGRNSWGKVTLTWHPCSQGSTETVWNSKKYAPAWGPAPPSPLCPVRQQLKPGVHPWVAPAPGCL